MEMRSLIAALLFVLFAAGSAIAAEPAEQPAVEEYELGNIDYYEVKIPTAGPAQKRLYRNLLINPQCGATGMPYEMPQDNFDPKSCYNRGVGILRGDFDDLPTTGFANSGTVKDALYYSGSVEKPRLESAYSHFKGAANKGFAPALYAIGLMLHNGYEPGEGIEQRDPQNPNEPVDYNERALKYLQMAADMGFERAAPLFAELQAEKEAGAASEAAQRLRAEEAKRLQAERDRQAREAQAAADAAVEAEKRRLQAEEENARIVAGQRAAANAALYSKFLAEHQREIIDIVRESWLAAYPKNENYPPVGKVFERAFGNPRWELREAADGRWLVVFTGIGSRDGQNAKIRLTFVGQPLTEEQLRNGNLVFVLAGLAVNDEDNSGALNNLLANIYLN